MPVLGFFRFTVGAHAGFGVRIPIQISGKASPTYIYRLEYEDAVDTFLTELKAETLDADAAFFKSTGLPDHKNFDGDEIFASMGVGYGYKLHVLGFDVLYKKYKEWQVGPRWDVDPPLSGTLQTISSYFIPWQVTNTGFDLGILWGSVRIGAKLENRATIDADFSPYIEDQSTGERKYTYCTDNVNAHWPADGNRVAHGATSGCEVTFGDETTLHPFVSQIPRYIYSEGHDYDYGFELKRLSYASEWALTPGLKFNLGIGYSWWGFDYTKNFWIDSLRWYIAHIRLGTHAGTQATQNIDVGTKYYRVPDR